MSVTKQDKEWRPNKQRLKIAAISVGIVVFIAQVLGWLYPFGSVSPEVSLTLSLVFLVLLAVPMFYLSVTTARWVVECKMGQTESMQGKRNIRFLIMEKLKTMFPFVISIGFASFTLAIGAPLWFVVLGGILLFFSAKSYV
jgi:hypothetical protein